MNELTREQIQEKLEAIRDDIGDLLDVCLREPESEANARLDRAEVLDFIHHVASLPGWINANIRFWKEEPHVYPPKRFPPSLEEFVKRRKKANKEPVEESDWYENHTLFIPCFDVKRLLTKLAGFRHDDGHRDMYAAEEAGAASGCTYIFPVKMKGYKEPR
jgi:hypothetical protein